MFFVVILIVTRTRGRNGKIADRGLERCVSLMLASEEEHIGASASATQPVEFSGGSYDTSYLVKYENHVARHL